MQAALDHAPVEFLRCRVIAEFGSETIEQRIDRKDHDLRIDDARFQLVDVEQRVQHARHDSKRLVELADQRQGVLVLDRLRQYSAQQAEGLQRLAQIVAGGGEKARFAEIGLLRMQLGNFQHAAQAFALGDILDRHKDFAARRRPDDLTGRQAQRSPARQRRQIEFDFIILDVRFSGSNAIEEQAQTRIVEVQSAGRADGLSNGLFPLGAEGVVKGDAGGNDPKFAIENHKRLANGLDDAVGIGPRRFDFAFRHLQLGNIGEGDDHALDPVVMRLVGQDAPCIPCPFIAFDLAAEGHEIRQHRCGIDEEILIVGTAGKVGERPSDVGCNDAEMRFHRRREEADVQSAVEEDRRDIGAGEHVLQIVGGGALLFYGFVKLAVEGRQLLIERLQFFLRGFQLFIDGL